MNTSYTALAAALRELSDRAAALADEPALATARNPFVMLNVLPGQVSADRGNARLVDVVAQALIDQPGSLANPVGVDRRYKAEGQLGPVHLSVHAVVPDPAAEDLRAEVARLHAQLAARDAEDTSVRDEAEWLARRAADRPAEPAPEAGEPR